MFMVVGIIVMKIENRKDWASMSGFLMWIDLELYQPMRSTQIYTTEKTVITTSSSSHYPLTRLRASLNRD